MHLQFITFKNGTGDERAARCVTLRVSTTSSAVAYARAVHAPGPRGRLEAAEQAQRGGRWGRILTIGTTASSGLGDRPAAEGSGGYHSQV